MATDTRRANINWLVCSEQNTYLDHQYYQYAQLAVMLDIRDELQRLNALLHCSNFTSIPRVLRTISRKVPTRRRRTTKK